MPQPLIFEVNTRCWLRALSKKLGRLVTLATVPEEEITWWQTRGCTHIWLMGVWATGPKTRNLARAQPVLRTLSEEAFGTSDEEKLVSSPFAVADFTVAEPLGGDLALRPFRAQLHRHGLGLLLDFIPNHVGLDHRWLLEKNGLFVRSATPRPETFPVVQPAGTNWVAHGKDPYFPAWNDTAQLDYRLAATRAAMIEVLQSIAEQCDGVRCDMAMLLLNDVFARTWVHFPLDAPAPPREFWAEAISAVKERHPNFMFIAEAYWDLEPRLAALGFDYVYDKKFFDYLTRRDYPALQRHVRAVQGKFHPVRFLENHDEDRIASVLSVPEQKAAAVLLLAQPGLRLLHDGQLSGKTQRTPVQYADYWPEFGNPEMTHFYARLLSVISQTVIGGGKMEFCETGLPHGFVMKWTGDGQRISLAAVNLAPQPAEFLIRESGPVRKMASIFSDGASTWRWSSEGVHLNLAPYGYELLEWRQTNR